MQVIQQTANFVREGGGQLEVLLRVKQAGNPLFDFLLPTSTLHPFYRWLVTTRPEDLVVINAAPLSWGRKGEGQNGQHGNALDAGARGETRGPVQQGQREVQQAEQRAAPHPLQQEQEGQREPQDEAAELDHAEPAGRAGYCVQYGPEPRPPGEFGTCKTSFHALRPALSCWLATMGEPSIASPACDYYTLT